MKLSNSKAFGQVFEPEIPRISNYFTLYISTSSLSMKFDRIQLKIEETDPKLQNEPKNMFLAASNQKLVRRA